MIDEQREAIAGGDPPGSAGGAGASHPEESPIDLSYLCDAFLLRYFEAHGEMRQAISMVKRRTGPHERSIRELRLDASGVRVGAPLADFHGIMGGQLVCRGQTSMLEER